MFRALHNTYVTSRQSRAITFPLNFSYLCHFLDCFTHMPTRTLSRSNFDLASQSFLKKYDPISDPTYLAEGLRGWAWNEHTVRRLA